MADEVEKCAKKTAERVDSITSVTGAAELLALEVIEARKNFGNDDFKRYQQLVVDQFRGSDAEALAVGWASTHPTGLAHQYSGLTDYSQWINKGDIAKYRSSLQSSRAPIIEGIFLDELDKHYKVLTNKSNDQWGGETEISKDDLNTAVNDWSHFRAITNERANFWGERQPDTHERLGPNEFETAIRSLARDFQRAHDLGDRREEVELSDWKYPLIENFRRLYSHGKATSLEGAVGQVNKQLPANLTLRMVPDHKAMSDMQEQHDKSVRAGTANTRWAGPPEFACRFELADRKTGSTVVLPFAVRREFDPYSPDVLRAIRE